MNSKIVQHYKKGSIIIMANSINPGYVYILKSGEVQIDSVFQFQNRSINFYSSGDAFGYVSAITKNPHTSTLTAYTDCLIIRISIESFFEYLKANRTTYLKILTKISEKLGVFIDHIDPFKKLGNTNFELPEKVLEHVPTYKKNNQIRLACFSLIKYIKGSFNTEKNKETFDSAKQELMSLDSRYALPDYLVYTEELSFEVKKGDILFVENETEDDFFYILERGSIKISKILNGHEIILGIITKGEIFGEMAIINKKLRNATAIAFEDSQIRRYTSSTILETLDEEILHKLFIIISRRLWIAYNRVFLLKVTDPNVKLYIQLQMLIADEITKSEHNEDKGKFIFRFSLNELLKMVDSEGIDSEKVSEFLSDKNLSFKNGQVLVKNKSSLDEKVETLKKKQIRLMKQIIL